jgi:hypothetical protein
MTSSITLFTALLLGAVGYEQVAVIGRPDTLKLLLSPQRVAELRDTVIVLDEERPGSLLLKRFSTDGEFVGERTYDPSDDSILFADHGFRPDSASLAPLMRQVDAGAFTLIGAARTGDTLWTVYNNDIGSGDAVGYDIAAIDARADSVVAHGWGPTVSSVYAVSSLREHLMPRRPSAATTAVCVGKNHFYLVAAGFVWQYDKQVRLVRRFGRANGCFLEPSGLEIMADGTLVVGDYRLGTIWRYDARTGQLAVQADSLVTGTSSVAYLAGASTDDLWFTSGASLHRLRMGHTEKMQFNEIYPREGGIILRVAQTGPLVVLSDLLGIADDLSTAYVYDTAGKLLHQFEGDHSDPRYAGICGMDNRGNVVLARSMGIRGWQFWRLSASAQDTTPLVVRDTSAHMTPGMFRLCSRLGDTLYVLGAREPGRSGAPAHALYTFVQDSLVDVTPSSSFSDGLKGYYTDFAVDRHGDLWIADIGERVVYQYRAVRR